MDNKFGLEKRSHTFRLLKLCRKIKWFNGIDAVKFLFFSFSSIEINGKYHFLQMLAIVRRDPLQRLGRQAKLALTINEVRE